MPARLVLMALPSLDPRRQIAFLAALDSIRDRYLGRALGTAVASLPIPSLDAELAEYVSAEALSRIAGSHLRGEVFFAVPCLLARDPHLLGYYRLLYGLSQKSFYHGKNFGPFQSMEARGTLTASNRHRLPELCAALAGTGRLLVAGLSRLSLDAVHELQLLTYGPQLKGGENNAVGSLAVRTFYAMLRAMLEPYVEAETVQGLVLRNSSGARIRIQLAADPDLDIRDVTNADIPLLAIEVKGGKDDSNKFNRLGEAEKSHQTAKSKGHNRFWTVVMVDYPLDSIATKSPTTQRVWHLERLSDPASDEYRQFRDLLASILGLPRFA